MAPLSRCLALHIGPLSKNRQNKFFFFDIYGFAINRIYRKTLQFVYLDFFLWGQCHREIIFQMWEQKPLRVIREKNSAQCRQSRRHQPRCCRRSVSYNRVNVTKPELWNFNRLLALPGHLQRNFWRRQRVISSKYDGAGAWQLPLPSAAEQQSWSRRHKHT